MIFIIVKIATIPLHNNLYCCLCELYITQTGVGDFSTPKRDSVLRSPTLNGGTMNELKEKY
jgi:hypothetical protein